MSHQHRRFLIAATVAASAAVAMPAQSQPLAMTEPDEPAPVYRQFIPERYASGSIASRPSREQAVEQQELLVHCLERIRPELRGANTYEAYCRLVIQGWSVERVCDTFGMTRNQVVGIKFRVSQRLREKLAEIIGEDDL